MPTRRESKPGTPIRSAQNERISVEAHRKLDEMLATHFRKGTHGLQVLCISTVDGTGQRVGTGLWLKDDGQSFMVA